MYLAVISGSMLYASPAGSVQKPASIQYAVTKDVYLFAQALNLTDRKSIKYFGVPDRIEDHEGYGRRFAVGARVKF